MCERSCWAITHIVGDLGNFAFGRLHKSTQVWTNGSISVSLNTQSLAKTISMSISPDKLDDSRPSKFGIVDIKVDSQSKAAILILLNAVGRLWAVDFPQRCFLLLADLCLVVFSAMLSFSVLKTYS